MIVFSYYVGPGYFWFRIFGKGLRFKHVSHGLLFSERNGFTKYRKVFKNYYVSYLE